MKRERGRERYHIYVNIFIPIFYEMCHTMRACVSVIVMVLHKNSGKMGDRQVDGRSGIFVAMIVVKTCARFEFGLGVMPQHL